MTSRTRGRSHQHQTNLGICVSVCQQRRPEDREWPPEHSCDAEVSKAKPPFQVLPLKVVRRENVSHVVDDCKPGQKGNMRLVNWKAPAGRSSGNLSHAPGQMSAEVTERYHTRSLALCAALLQPPGIEIVKLLSGESYIKPSTNTWHPKHLLVSFYRVRRRALFGSTRALLANTLKRKHVTEVTNCFAFLNHIYIIQKTGSKRASADITAQCVTAELSSWWGWLTNGVMMIIDQTTLRTCIVIKWLNANMHSHVSHCLDRREHTVQKLYTGLRQIYSQNRY